MRVRVVSLFVILGLRGEMLDVGGVVYRSGGTVENELTRRESARAKWVAVASQARRKRERSGGK